MREYMTPKKISEKDIREWVSAVSSQRGYRYFQDGAILDPRRQGIELKALCEGTQVQPYRVRVTFGEEGITGAHCSCPVGGGGYCKHVAALLFTYQNQHGDFRDVEELDVALEKQSKEELIALVKQMIARRPELEHMLEIRLSADGASHTPVDPETYRRLAASVFHHTRFEWGAEEDIENELDSIIELGKGLEYQGDHANAAIVFQAVSQEVLSHYEMLNDEEGELGNVVISCVEGLAQCLSGVQNDFTIREKILDALFEIYRFDVDFGGVGLSDDVPDIILNQARPEERRTLAGWVRAAMPADSTDSWSGKWHRQKYGGFLLELEHEILEDGDYLQICRETGRLGDLVDRLLTLKRHDEAIAEAEKASDYEMLHLADIFQSHGRWETAEQLLVERANISEDSRILERLKACYDERGDTSAALTLALSLFHNHTNLSRYQEIRVLAKKVDEWDKLRLQLVSEMADRELYNVLTEIHMEEGDIDRALVTLNLIKGFPWGTDLRTRVARAAEETHPQAAIHLYQQLAETLIDSRGRDNYRRACPHLSRARMLCECIGQKEMWTPYIQTLRERNRKLRALMDELAKAGI